MDLLYPLRLTVRAMRRVRQNRAEAKYLRAYLADCDETTAVVPGTPLHRNLGDSAIFLAQKAYLESLGYKVKEITWTQIHTHRKLIRKLIPRKTLIAQLGGGNMGNQWIKEEELHRTLTLDYPHNPTVIFPQTVYFTPDADGEKEKEFSAQIYGGHPNLIWVTREKRSYDAVRAMCPESTILLTPDIVLSATMDTFGAAEQSREGILLCMRSDLERSTTDEMQAALEQMLSATGLPVRKSDMYTDETVTAENRADLVRRKMEEFAAARLVVTDRLHGMIFATLTGTPCIVFTNTNYKISGSYEWLRYLLYVRYVESGEEATDAVSVLLEMGECRFDNASLAQAFQPLRDAVRRAPGKSL